MVLSWFLAIASYIVVYLSNKFLTAVGMSLSSLGLGSRKIKSAGRVASLPWKARKGVTPVVLWILVLYARTTPGKYLGHSVSYP